MVASAGDQKTGDCDRVIVVAGDCDSLTIKKKKKKKIYIYIYTQH